MNKEIEWFCYHTTQEGLLSPEQCHAVAEAIQEAEGVEEDLATFAQTVVDNELCTDTERLEEFMRLAQEAAEGMELPPVCILSDDKTEQQKETEVSSEGQGSSPSEEDATITQQASSVSVLRDWPEAATAEEMEGEDAKTFMEKLLRQARESGCSDLHICPGAPPFVRYKTNVHVLGDQQVVSTEAARRLNFSLLTETQQQSFEEHGDLDSAYATDQGERYRMNMHYQRGSVAGAYRVIDQNVVSLQELGFERTETLEKLTTYHQGLILVTGPAGCGKSTTLNSFIDMINQARNEHIITVEDPVEYVHTPKKCNITQREIGRHTESFPKALRAALREDPDIIVIGELRDLETIEMAIRASETGHLVLGTLHTTNAATTLDRILDVFPPAQQGQIRSMVSENLKGVISQELILGKNEKVALASEIMLGTLAIANIIREGDTFKLPSTIQTSYNAGMQTLEQSVFNLYMQDELSYEQAIERVESDDLVRKMQTNEAKRAAEASGASEKKRGWFR